MRLRPAPSRTCSQIPTVVASVAPTWPAAKVASQRYVPIHRSTGASTIVNWIAWASSRPLSRRNADSTSTRGASRDIWNRFVLWWRRIRVVVGASTPRSTSVVTARISSRMYVPGAAAR
jgi:hypothetical protein